MWRFERWSNLKPILKEMPCLRDPKPEDCEENVLVELPCNHSSKKPCRQRESELSGYKCKELVFNELPCGHSKLKLTTFVSYWTLKFRFLQMVACLQEPITLFIKSHVENTRAGLDLFNGRLYWIGFSLKGAPLGLPLFGRAWLRNRRFPNRKINKSLKDITVINHIFTLFL